MTDNGNKQTRLWTELDHGSPETPSSRGGGSPRPEDSPAQLSRRSFFKLAGLGAASASLAACERLPVRTSLPFSAPPEGIIPGVSLQYAGTCTACSAACGLMATVRDGRPIKLEGHPDHPLSSGGLCALGQGDLRSVYDSGRLRAPRIEGADSTWDAVDDRVRAGLTAAKSAGKKVYVLSRTVNGPTVRAALTGFLAAYDGVLVEHDPGPGSRSSVLAAYALLVGEPLAPSLHFEEADLLVSLGGDFLATGPDPVVNTASYAARRRLGPERGPLRHVHVEGSLSLTGASADERWQARADERRLLALHLVARLAAKAGAGDVTGLLGSVPPVEAFAARLDALATQLWAHRGKALVLSGSDDVAEQVAVAVANHLLDADGGPLRTDLPSRARLGRDSELSALLTDLKSGAVGALFVFDLDPMEQLPDVAALSESLANVPLTVALTDRPTATAEACKIVAAAHHGLERWADFSPRIDILTTTQPMLRPLFETRDPLESFLVWSGADVVDPRLHLANSFKKNIWDGSGDFDRWWMTLVARGIANTRPASGTGGRADFDAASGLREALAGGMKPPEGGLEVELIAEVGVRDGSRSHVPWLRELPDPLTRVSWTAVARVAPSFAAAQGLTDGSVVTVATDAGAVTLPVRVQPGQHPGVVAVPVGYGRVDSEHPDPARNAYALASFSGAHLRLAGLAGSVTATGAAEELPLMQVYSRIDDGLHRRPIVHEVDDYEAEVELPHHIEHHSLWPLRGAESDTHWDMTIDLDACTACSACIIACQAENNLPVVGPEEIGNQRDMYWLRMDRYFVGDVDEPRVLFEPMLCQQCDDAPCETVCPVAATVHSSDGLNQQAYNRCVGTRYCANNCPYKVRRFNWFDSHLVKDEDPLERMVLNPDVVVRERGIMEKCSFCVQRIQGARIEAKVAGQATFEVMTACQQSCPAKAIQFGNGRDPESRVAALRDGPRSFRVLEELGVRPSVTYLARVRPGAAAHDDAGGGHHGAASTEHHEVKT